MIIVLIGRLAGCLASLHFAALATAGAAQQADLATLQEAVNCYSSRLGLRLESSQGKRHT